MSRGFCGRNRTTTRSGGGAPPSFCHTSSRVGFTSGSVRFAVTCTHVAPVVRPRLGVAVTGTTVASYSGTAPTRWNDTPFSDTKTVTDVAAVVFSPSVENVATVWLGHAPCSGHSLSDSTALNSRST